MGLMIGVVADDFTGATDIAGFLVASGLRTVQLSGVQQPGILPEDADAVVISLKSRSNPVDEAIEQSLGALRMLVDAGAERLYFKYCSTFDSTPAGNIGPVTDAMLAELGEDFTVVCPALPVNGRTTYFGYLFVNGIPLHESGMRNHPVTPMTDSNLMRLMEGQSEGRAGNVPSTTVDQGPEAVRDALAALRRDGVRYAVLDALHDSHVETLGEAVRDLRLVTGGSGLGGGIAAALSGTSPARVAEEWVPSSGRAVVLSGSASVMTNSQVEAYRREAPSVAVDLERLMADGARYESELAEWVLSQPAAGLAPLIYATADADEVRRTQERWGARESGAAIESLFAALARTLRDRGVSRFVVAGGETSGAVTTALGVRGFHVGPQIAPGVPWVRSLDGGVDLALKSGNFGDADFFFAAQQLDN